MILIDRKIWYPGKTERFFLATWPLIFAWCIYLCTRARKFNTSVWFVYLWIIIGHCLCCLIKRPVRGRLFVFMKFSAPPPPPLPHYVLPWIAPSLYNLFFSFLATIYLRHGKIFPHGETWPPTFIKVTWPKTIFSQVHPLVIAFQKKLLTAGGFHLAKTFLIWKSRAD